MGKKQKKKQRNLRNLQRGGAGKHNPVVASSSPAGTMTPVPISSPGDESSSSSPKLGGTVVCPHVERGVKLEKLRSQFVPKPLPQCQSCTRSRPSRGAKAGAKNDLWICLACGNLGCGWHTADAKDGTILKPSFLHARTHRNQWQHPVVMQWSESFDCWCLECDMRLVYSADEAASARSRLLQKAAALLQESISGHSSGALNVESSPVVSGPVVAAQIESGPVASPQVEATPEVSRQVETGEVETSQVETGQVEEPASKGAVRQLASRRVIKGLMNLGNTCFFNSVMQNLVGVSMLREHFSKQAAGQEGTLKTALRNFFEEMDPSPDGADGGSGRTIHTRSFGGSVGSAVSPRGLFFAICSKAPRFKGFQQQDSHELLRCLLDGLHMEEESIRKAAESFWSEGSPKKMPETFVEQMFGGQLSSTVSCCECGHSSVVYEPYLDLSLPIPSKQERNKGESIRVQLPKLNAQRSQRGNASGNGVLSLNAVPFNAGLVDNAKPTALEDPKQAREVPVLGCSLGPLSLLDAGAGNSETRNDSEEKQMASTTGDDKNFVGQGFDDLPSTSYPCENISEAIAASSSRSGKIEGWLDYLDEPLQEISGESAAMSFLDQSIGTTLCAAPDSNQSRQLEIGGSSANQGEEISISSPGDMFSMQGGGNESMDDGNQMDEETIEYGPLLPGAQYHRVENNQQCLDLVLLGPDVSNMASYVKEQTAPGCHGETSAGDREIMSTSDSKLGALVPAEDDGDLNGVAGLFADENSFSRSDTGSEYKFSNCGTDANSFSNFDSIVTVPSFTSDMGQISGGRAVSAKGVREVETYPIMSLEGCLQAFTKTEVLSGENAWGCENCTRIAHGLRQRELSEETVDSNGSKSLSDIDGEFESPSVGRFALNGELEPPSVGRSALNAIHDALDAEGDGLQGEWESLRFEDRTMEDLNTSTNSLSIVVVPQARDVSVKTLNNGNSMIESSTNEMVDGEQNAVGGSNCRAGPSSADLTSVDGTSLNKAHNTLKRSQSLDCFDESASVKAGEFRPSSSSKEKEDIDEPYVMVEASSVSAGVVEDDTASRNGRRRRNNAEDTKGGTVKPSSRGPQDGSKKLEKEAPKMVTVNRDATKRFLISKAPLVLTVHLKRFAQDLHGRLSKLSGHITFHEQLDLGPFIDQRDGVKRDGVYQLIGTVEHSGTMRGGHYVAYVKGLDGNGENDAENSADGGSTWYYISDSHVRKTSLESVLQSEAYLLFYERRTFE